MENIICFFREKYLWYLCLQTWFGHFFLNSCQKKFCSDGTKGFKYFHIFRLLFRSFQNLSLEYAEIKGEPCRENFEKIVNVKKMFYFVVKQKIFVFLIFMPRMNLTVEFLGWILFPFMCPDRFWQNGGHVSSSGIYLSSVPRQSWIHENILMNWRLPNTLYSSEVRVAIGWRFCMIRLVPCSSVNLLLTWVSPWV